MTASIRHLTSRLGRKATPRPAPIATSNPAADHPSAAATNPAFAQSVPDETSESTGPGGPGGPAQAVPDHAADPADPPATPQEGEPADLDAGNRGVIRTDRAARTDRATKDSEGGEETEGAAGAAEGLAAAALHLLPTHLLDEAVDASCPWTRALPPAARRQFLAQLDAQRRDPSAPVEALLTKWRQRSSLFIR